MAGRARAGEASGPRWLQVQALASVAGVDAACRAAAQKPRQRGPHGGASRLRCWWGRFPAAGPPGRVLSPSQALRACRSSSASPASLMYPAVLSLVSQGFKSPAAITDLSPPSRHQTSRPMFGSCFQVHNRLQLYVFLMN